MSIIYSNIHNINRNIGTLACNKNNIEICRKVIKLQIKFCGIIANIWDENSTQMFFFCLKHVVTWKCFTSFRTYRIRIIEGNYLIQLCIYKIKFENYPSKSETKFYTSRILHFKYGLPNQIKSNNKLSGWTMTPVAGWSFKSSPFLVSQPGFQFIK